MARWMTPTDEQERGLAEWKASRPDVVRAMMDKLDIWSLYRMKSTGHRVTIYSFYENGMVTVNVTGEYNSVAFDRRVFGVDPDDLEPCDLPGPNEPVGTVLTAAEVADNIDMLRVTIRPDLFVMGPDGKAVRKS
jgi:hypothetical protein